MKKTKAEGAGGLCGGAVGIMPWRSDGRVLTDWEEHQRREWQVQRH